MVIELIRPERSGLGGDLAAPGDHGRDQLRRDALRAGISSTSAPNACIVQSFSAGEGIRRHDAQRVALHRADEGERRAGAASAVFDDRLTGPSGAHPARRLRSWPAPSDPCTSLLGWPPRASPTPRHPSSPVSRSSRTTGVLPMPPIPLTKPPLNRLRAQAAVVRRPASISSRAA